jgi:hypothetical protein
VNSDDSYHQTLDCRFDRRIELLRIACKQLQKAPIAATLKETIALAHSPKAAAFRQKLEEWTGRLREGDVGGAELVLMDIAAARKQLLAGRIVNSAGSYATIIGGFATAASLALFPPATPIGAGVTVFGLLALGTEQEIKARNQWAMFASM